MLLVLLSEIDDNGEMAADKRRFTPMRNSYGQVFPETGNQ